jgi:hypothetical protein
MPFEQGKVNVITVEKWNTLHENVDCHDATNKELEEEENKKIEKTSMGREEETTGETFKVQKTMDLPSMHEPQKS